MGNIFLNQQVLKWMPTIALLTFLGLLMISTRFKGEKTLRKMVEVQEMVKELRSESSTVESELMKLSRYSAITKEVEKRGLDLKQSEKPPMKIYVKK